MDLVQIKYFLTLADTLNFTRAAERCSVSQPALTKSIKRLEDEMGGPLLLRERRLTQLTELGQRVLPALRQAFEAAQSARDLALSHRHEERRPLRLGLDPNVNAYLLVPLLRELAKRLAGFELTLKQVRSADMEEMLLNSRIDLCLTTDAETLKSKLHHWALFDDAVVALLPEAHELAATDPVASEALGSHLSIGRSDEDCPLDRVRARLAARGDCSAAAGGQPVHRAVTDAQVKDLVLAGLGIGLSTARQPAWPGVRRPHLAPPEHLTVSIAVVAGRPLSRAADCFLKLARARAWHVEPP